jgi:hypothetical protein
MVKLLSVIINTSIYSINVYVLTFSSLSLSLPFAKIMDQGVRQGCSILPVIHLYILTKLLALADLMTLYILLFANDKILVACTEKKSPESHL